MVSNQSAYRNLSPPRYRRQTLAVYNSMQNHHDNEDGDTQRSEPLLNRNRMHRSVGDLSSNRDLHVHDPRSTSTFYQQLYEKYPYAFHHHPPEQREATRRVFNTQHHVRFEDTELYDDKLYKDPFTVRRHDLSHLTNWDKEVGHYFKNGTNVRDCLTSAETSEISGPTRMRQFNSETLNRLLNEKSPLRRRFQDGTLSTRSELDIQDYFLEKSKARSRHRKKRCRVLQRKIDKDNEIDLNAKENTPNHENIDNGKTNSKMSDLGINNYEISEQNKRVDVNTLMTDTDLKINTLLEKISLKMSSPDSLPDSAIDIDTPSVQSFVSADKGGHSDTNQCSEQPNLKNSAINRNGASRSLENGLDFYEKELKRLQEMNRHIARYTEDNHADENDEQETVIETNQQNKTHNISERTQNLSNSPSSRACQNQGLLQIYIDPNNSGRFEKLSENNPDDVGEKNIVDRSEENMSETSSTMESLSSDVQSVRSCVERPVYSLSGSNGDIAVSAGSKGQGQSRDSDVDSGIGQSSSGTERERGRSRGRTPVNIMKTNQSVLPSRSDVDCCILDEVNLLNSDHLVSHQRDSLNETDDTADVRLGIPKVTEEEVQIAEKYRRTRSPSPYVLTSTRRLSVGRPNSAPCLVKGNYEMHVVDISISEKPRINSKNSPKQNKNTSCQNDKNNSSNGSIDHINSDSIKSAKISDTDNTSKDIFRNLEDNGHIQTVKTSPKRYDNEYSPNSLAQHKKGQSAPFCTELMNDEENTKYERRYKPGVTSPRVKEKREKLRNKMKSKSEGSINGTNDKQEHRHNVSDSGQSTGRLINRDKHESIKPDSEDERFKHDVHNAVDSDDDVYDISNASSRRLNDMEHVPNNRIEVNADVHQTIPSANHHNIKHEINNKKDINNQDDIRTGDIDKAQRDTRPDVIKTTELETQPKAPPVKPARTKRKKTLSSEVDFQDNNLKPSEAGSVTTDTDLAIQMDNAKHKESHLKNAQNDRERLQDFHTGEITDASQYNEGRQPKHHTNKKEAPPIPKSNLESSRHLSASKVSLFDKVGNLKTATKGKFKKLRKAMSLERGIDDCGVEMNPDPHGNQNRSHDNKGGHSTGFKMKKAPSLKSLTSLFGKIRKKKGKWSSEETPKEGIPGLSGTSQHSGQLSLAKRQQWTSCHTLSTNPSSSQGRKPVGKLLELNKDGSQVIQLFKPESGPIGFFIARGTNKYCNGIFVSRIAETKTETSFAGLLEVGDEILEVNGHFVRDLSQDAVYDLISARPNLVMKVLPIIARKDVY